MNIRLISTSISYQALELLERGAGLEMLYNFNFSRDQA